MIVDVVVEEFLGCAAFAIATGKVEVGRDGGEVEVEVGF